MKKILAFAAVASFCILNFAYTGCTVSYGFSEKNTKLPDSIKTINVRIVQQGNQGYVNPQLITNLTDRLKQKVVRQTKLTQVNSDNAHLDITSVVRDYSVTTAGVSSGNNQSQASVNRLTVSIQVTITNQLSGEVKEHTVSRSFDFSARQSLNQAESQLMDEMVRNLSDEIFNRIFSDW